MFTETVGYVLGQGADAMFAIVPETTILVFVAAGVAVAVMARLVARVTKGMR